MNQREAVPYDVLQKGLRCPRCANLMTGHATDDPKARPKDEDLTICWHCEGLLQYTRTPFGWTLNSADRRDLSELMRAQVDELYGRVREGKSAGRRPTGFMPDVAERDGHR